MACTSIGLSRASPAAAKDVRRKHDGLHRSDSASELRCDAEGMRRSRSEPQLKRSLSVTTRATSAEPARLKTSRSIGVLPFGFSTSIFPNSIRSFLFDAEEGSDESEEVTDPEAVTETERETEKRANWVGRLLEVRNRWRDRQQKDGEVPDDVGDGECGVCYDDEEEVEEEREWDRESFSKLLAPVAWSDAKLFSKLAFLCNKAYVIPSINVEDIKKNYGLEMVTTSLEWKAKAFSIKDKLNDVDSTKPPSRLAVSDASGSQQKHLVRPSVAYDVAASAASYVHSRAKGFSEPCGGATTNTYNSEVAASVAASTMTAVVAAEEAAKQEAAKDLRSPHSAPCEWFVCDNPNTYTRCFVIQGSDSLASWQANLFFEPTKFEGMEVMVHRGIYEAAKGIYEQFLPEIEAHLARHGDRAKLRFTGHSLGGSISLLVSLMLLSRQAIPHRALLPVVTFGSPSVLCGGGRVLDELGLDESHVSAVMMHRDIVPRAFSCNYPNHVAQVLKRLNGAFRSHPCLNNKRLLYSPMGRQFILQPDEKASPSHPLLPAGAALYSLDGAGAGESNAVVESAMRAFLNSPHPLETLSHPKAYGSEGTILRDHDSSNYVKAVNGVVRRRSSRYSAARRQWWPLLTTPTGLPGLAWSVHGEAGVERGALVAKEAISTVA